MTSKSIKSRKTQIGVGDHVIIPWGVTREEAVVIEDRGRLGAEGERILRVHLKLGDDIDQEFEIPETDVIERVSS
jgi:hypothetical protein